MDIVWLGEPQCYNLTLVGGKAANLSLLAASHRVPPGFCLTTSAFERWKSEGRTAMPRDLYDQIAQAYRELSRRAGGEPGVAVRSSAVDEDGSSASFAGQHDTYLNICGAEAVADAVLRCWNSVTNERALQYRRQRGLSADSVRLAVLVQQLVPADVSGVVFSANPVTGSRDESVINASWGLGESVVSGSVTPDTYIVRNSDLAILDSQVSDKSRMTVAVDGGAAEVDVPLHMRFRPALDESQIAEMVRLALALQDSMGWPVDIECAYRGRELYLLQCRPITTLR
ncbi:MAG: PEP/pyruvate-binding domain-containing protein [Chloroflexi bacterium]|nr:PEP/pyruvate-binding domain-containing protein [Chloroflexota bacterium]